MSQRSFSVDFLLKFLFSRKAGAIIKIIAWLSIAGIGIGVAALVLVLSVMNGFNKSMRTKRFSVEPHLVMYFDKMPMSEIEKHPGYQWIKAQKEVKADITESQDVLLRSADGFIQAAIAQGVTKNTLYYIINHNRKAKGRTLLRKEDMRLASGEMLMGGGIGDSMGLFEGDEVIVLSPEAWIGPKESTPMIEKMRVQNFLRTDIENIDAYKFFYIIGDSLVRLRKSASLERTVEVRLPNPEAYGPYKKKLESLGVRVDSWMERNSNLFYSLKLEKFVVGLLLGLSTLIASFSLVTVMTLLVTQKKKDIGLLLALGFTPERLQQVFMKLGIMLSAIGIGGGVLVGVVSSLLVDKYSQGILPNIYEDTSIPAQIFPSQVLIVTTCAFVFSLFTIWLSLRKMSEMEPVQALRG